MTNKKGVSTNPLLMPPVLDRLFSMLDTRHLCEARHVCLVWRQVADDFLSRRTLYWDYWHAPSPPAPSLADHSRLMEPVAVVGCPRTPCVADNGAEEALREDDGADVVADLETFLASSLRLCPFRVGWALLFVGSCQRFSKLADLPSTIVTRLRQLAPDVSPIVFDSYSMQSPHQNRVIGTGFSALSPAIRSSELGQKFDPALFCQFDAPAAVSLLLIRAPTEPDHVKVTVTPVDNCNRRRRALLPDELLSESRALLLLSCHYDYHDEALKQLQLAISQLPQRLAVGGGVLNSCWTERKVPSVFVSFSGSCVRAASCVLHGNGSGDERRCRFFIRRIQLLNFPRHNTVAIVFANSALRRRALYASVECRMFRQTFPTIPLIGANMPRQVGRCSSMPMRRRPQTGGMALNRSVVFVLLHVARTPITCDAFLCDRF